MAEKKGVGHAYNIDFLNVVFAVSSLFLFIAVIWMVWDDYDREWKNTQRRFAQLEYEVTQANLEKATRGVDQKKLTALQTQLNTVFPNAGVTVTPSGDAVIVSALLVTHSRSTAREETSSW